jgi:hypothetical protein
MNGCQYGRLEDGTEDHAVKREYVSCSRLRSASISLEREAVRSPDERANPHTEKIELTAGRILQCLVSESREFRRIGVSQSERGI